MKFQIIIAILIVFPAILIGNLLLFYIWIKTAIKRFVIPYLENKGYSLINYKWAGFFSCGDFKDEQMEFALFKSGPNSISVFAFIYYKELENTQKRTIKIYVESLSIKEITFSSEV